MRTTLKRGIGRAAEGENGHWNGSGNGALPLGTLGPITRYRQPAPPRRGVAHLLAKALVWLLIAAVTVAAGLLGGAYLYFRDTVDAVVAKSPEVQLAQEGLDIPLPGEPAIALVIGYDKRAGGEAEVNGARSDTVMLLRADPDTNALSMLSFPRDLVVTVHCPGQPPFDDRINEAYSTCGPQGTLETVRRLTGLPVNYLITVNFRGFKQMVAKLGGVWMDVDRRYFNDNSQGGERYATIDLEPGYQKLQGQDALDFVRYRHFDSDLYRLARQQIFVQAFKQAMASGFSITSLPKIVGVVRENLDVGAPGGELSSGTLLSYGRLGYELPKGNIFQTRIDHACYSGDAELHVPPECIERAVQDFSSPDVAAPQKATDVALGRKPRDGAPPPKETVVVVLNGNGIAGVAADTSYQLGQRGYLTVAPPNGLQPNAPSFDYLESKAYFSDDKEGAKAAATKLAGLIGEPGTVEVEPMPAEIAPLAGESHVVVVLGQTFAGTVTAAPVDQTPEPKEPEVATNRELTAPLLREAQKQLPFRLMVPTVVEQASRLDSTAPIRTYSMAGHPTLRLTFATGAAEFWGIQMVRWNGAPAIQGPNRRLHLGGRVYELHYNGPKLHMVVVRDPRVKGASYWVVNSLLNTLSNETMLAIAKGLKPLPAR